MVKGARQRTPHLATQEDNSLPEQQAKRIAGHVLRSALHDRALH